MNVRLWSLFCLLGMIGAGSPVFGEPATTSGFEGITLARLESIDNVPVLTLDGQRVPPLIFFFNNHAAVGPKRHYWEPQVKMSGEAGIHVYSFCLSMPPIGSGIEPSLASLSADLDPFIAADPKALFIPRINVTAHAAWLAANPGEQMIYADGSRGYEAIASELWKNLTHQQLKKYIAFIEASSYGQRFIGYHISGQTSGEWFPEGYREKGPDVGPANTRGFRIWLKAKYGTDQGLRDAWRAPGISLASAEVPSPAPGRFPIHNLPGGIEFEVFYRLPEERNWIDYSQYTSELTATRLIEFACLVKDVTQNRKLTVFFYGYNMDLPSSINGHNNLMRILQCPQVDILASPVTYGERLRGESTGFMSTVDSVAAHGKLWVIENDMRTHLWTKKHQPPEIADNPQFAFDLNFMPRPRDAAETVNILKRDFSAMRAHRCGVWWMDLTAVGAFKEPAIWKMINQSRPGYESFYEKPFPYQPEVAVLVDESSRNYEKSDWDISCQVFGNLRYQMGLTGASFGLYLLEDFMNGQVPPCKAYVFANAFNLNDAQVEAIRGRLEREASTAIWIYAPGYLANSQVSLEQSRRLTGIKLDQIDGQLGSYGPERDGEVLTWGVQDHGLDHPKAFTVSPRLVVHDDQAQIIGHYMSDGEASAAIKQQGCVTHVFVGDICLTAPLLRRLLREAKVHFWTDSGLVVHTDGQFVSVHAAEAGAYPIYCPDGVTLEAVSGYIQGHANGVLYAHFGRAETRTFKVIQVCPQSCQ